MKCQTIFSRGNNKNTISLSSAELAHSMESVNVQISSNVFSCFFFFFFFCCCCFKGLGENAAFGQSALFVNKLHVNPFVNKLHVNPSTVKYF